MSLINKHSNLPTPLNGGASFKLRNRVIRVIWRVTWFFLASWSPAPLHSWRRFLLRMFGATMGQRSDVRGSSRVWLPSNLTMADHALIGPKVNCYNQAMIKLGEHALVSQGTYLCAGTHDVDDPQFTLVAKPISIGDFAWLAADAFVGPGCTIGEGAVLGARAVAFGRLDAWTIYIGNPAKAVRKRNHE